MKAVNVHRTGLFLRADPDRVLVRPFNPSTLTRARKICARVLALPDGEVRALLEGVLTDFGGRHLKIQSFLKERFDKMRVHLPAQGQPLSEERQLLIGA